MKKRLLILGLLFVLLLMTLLLVKFAIDKAIRKPVLQKKLGFIVSATPLAYIQCSHLKTRLEQFMDSPEYQTFIQSEFVKQLQQTEWGAEFIFQFKQLWHSLIINPMHIIGTDAAVAVYNAEEGEIIPGVILVSKVDQVAKIAERVLYVFDRLGGQVGITFEQQYQHFSIYRIEQPDMICPLFYVIVDDIGMISTSLPLLKNSIRLALSPGSAGVSPATGDSRAEERDAGETPALPGLKTSPFTKILQDIPDKRFVTCYLDFSLFFKELRKNVIFRPLGLSQKNVKEGEENFPFLTIHLDTYSDKISLRTELFAASDISESPGNNLEDGVDSLILQDTVPANVSLVAAFYKESSRSFLQNWQALLPQWEWTFPIQVLAQPGNIFGEVLECYVSDTIVGTLYAIPDIACVLDTQNPGRAMIFLDVTIRNMLDQMLSPIVRRAVKISNEPYGGTRISKIHFMFQEFLNYGTVKSENRNSQGTYTLVTTNAKAIEEQVDSLRAHPGKRPYLFPSHQDSAASVIFLKNDQLSKLIQNVSRTNTFTLLYPRQTHKQLYQILPFLIHLLDTLPPMIIEGGTKGTELYLELRSRVFSPGNGEQLHGSYRV